MLADYILQTGWLIKIKPTPRGLGLHGFMVWLMSVFVLAPYLETLFIPITLMAVLHTIQDGIKLAVTPTLNKRGIHPIFAYGADQLSHYILIVLWQFWFTGNTRFDPIESYFMTIGACVVAVTRFYEVTWWSNWFKELYDYFGRWRWFQYAERLAMLGLSALGFFWLAPLCVLPRVWVSYRTKQPIWKQPYGLAEMLLGMAICIVLGALLWATYPESFR
jgi:hypothetical protein